MFEAENVGKRFGRRAVLDQVSFAAWPGQVTALIGHNGAGKTTLIREGRIALDESLRVLNASGSTLEELCLRAHDAEPRKAG